VTPIRAALRGRRRELTGAPHPVPRERRPKQRGGRRYYRALHRRADEFELRIGPDRWYDLWHDHFDWRGRGNVSGRQRNEHLCACFTALTRAREQASTVGLPIQVWLSIHPVDSADDALYAHTPNANGTEFPYAFSSFTFGARTPPLLRPFLQATDYRLGVSRFDGTDWFAVVPPESVLE
jgi:hypothetical protein